MKQNILNAIQLGADFLGQRLQKSDTILDTIGYTIAGSIGFIIRYLGNKMTNTKIILLNISIIVGIVFFIVPFLAEYFDLTYRTAAFLAWLFSTFNDKLMATLEIKVRDKFKEFNKKK